MPARTRSYVPAIASVCAVIALLALVLSAMAAPPAVAPQAPSGSLSISVNYSHDWVNAHTLSKAHVEVTVKRAGQTIATVGGDATDAGDFESNAWTWTPQRPDILPGDVVEATSSGATASVNPVGEIKGTLDAAHSSVSGEIIAPNLAPAKLTVVCQVWREGGGPEMILQNVAADHGAFTCDYGAEGLTLAPGDGIAVFYFEPDGDRVIGVFRMPGPDVAVDTWPEGNREARAGGRSVFHVVYRNDGDAAAENVLLTITPPTGVTYVAATLETEPVPAGSGKQWSLGTVPPGTQKHFSVVLENALQPGQSVENVVDISTSSLGDQAGNNHASNSVQVTSNSPDVNVGQWVNPGDVLVGDSYRVTINYGNNGPVPAGPVHLTVQLDPDVTLENWASQNGYGGFWKLTPGANGHFAFDAPALPGFWGDQLLLRVGVPSSMPADKELVSTVSIEVPLDPNGGDNGPFSQRVRTTTFDRPDLRVNKRWAYGQLAKGYHAVYMLDYGNDGNLSQQHVLLSDTLPAGTTFVGSRVNDNWGQSTPVPPLSNVDGKVTWDVGTLAPAQWGNLWVEVAFDDVQPGTTITNRADIAGLDRDRSWWNNHSSEVEQVNGDGPNLRVRSESSWESNQDVRFEIFFENIGTTVVDNVQLTDTLPEGLEFDNWWTNFWQPMEGGSYDPQTRKITWTTGRLEPNWTSSINIRARVRAADVDKQGLVFENTAQITVPSGELTPADNSTTTTAFTGPDLHIEKSLWSGKVAAGQLVTFLITIGNRNNGPWNTGNPPQGSPGIKIVDTLPAGMTFVRALAGPTEWKPDEQAGNVLTWYFPGMCAGCQWQFLVEASIAGTALGGSQLTNTAEIVDLLAGDFDPFSANNQSSWQGTVDMRRTFLPVLMR